MSKLFRNKLKNDPIIKKAKKAILSRLTVHQKKLVGLKNGDPKLQKEYVRLLNKCSELRGGNLVFPYLSSGLGKGPLVELVDGSVKYDFITGIGVHYMGHSHPKVVEACLDAALESTVMHGNLQQTHMTAELLELMVKTACLYGAKLKHCFLTTSGAMANENALKMIFQKNAPAKRFLAFKRNFAGRSMIMAQMTDKPENRVGLPKVLSIDYVPFFDPHHPKKSTKKAVDTLKKHLKAHPNDYAGMNFELIQGEAGYYPGQKAFFLAIIKVLKQHKVAVMIDEIQSFGRTTKPFAFQHFGLDKHVDVVTVGKSTQLCATFFTDEYKPKPGLISQTFTASSSAIYSAIVVLKTLLKKGFLGKSGRLMQLGKYFSHQLESLSKKYPDYIKGPFGIGAMVGMTVFDGSKENSIVFLKELYHQGVLAFVAGKNPTRIRFLMPVPVVTKKDINQVCKVVESSLIEASKLINKGKG